MAKGRRLWAVPAAIALACLALAAPAGAAGPPVGNFTPGVVEPPPPGRSLDGDVVLDPPAIAVSSALQGAPDVERIGTADGDTVIVETSPSYVPDLGYDEELVAFLDSLLHGHELDRLHVYVATPSEMRAHCGGAAAACYLPQANTITIVGQESYAGLPTSYAVAHEYGHRVESARRNPPFPGGALYWGTKRWASVEHVCQGALNGIFAPGDEGKYYFSNPGEAFAESFAWYHYGHSVLGWRWDPRLKPNAAAYAAIRADVLEPWRPTVIEDSGVLSRRGARKAYPVRPESDGWVQVQTRGSGDVDIGLYKGNDLVAESAHDGSNESINYVACGEHKLKLVVFAYRAQSRYELTLKTP
jgi:hypothetical protein